MKLVKEYIINEKFSNEENDPITDMGIGNVSQFKNLPELFGKKDKNWYIYTIYVRHGYIDFWFNHPVIKKLSDNKINNLFDYVKTIIDELGFSCIIINPIIIYSEDIIRSSIVLPMIVRFKLRSQFQHMLKAGSYRKWSNIFSYHESGESESTYEKEIENLKNPEK